MRYRVKSKLTGEVKEVIALSEERAVDTASIAMFGSVPSDAVRRSFEVVRLGAVAGAGKAGGK